MGKFISSVRLEDFVCERGSWWHRFGGSWGVMKWDRPAPRQGVQRQSGNGRMCPHPRSLPYSHPRSCGSGGARPPRGPDPARLASRSRVPGGRGRGLRGSACVKRRRPGLLAGRRARARTAGRGHCPARGGPRRPGGSSVTELGLCLVTSGTTQFLMFSNSCLQRKEENA